MCVFKKLHSKKYLLEWIHFPRSCPSNSKSVGWFQKHAFFGDSRHCMEHTLRHNPMAWKTSVWIQKGPKSLCSWGVFHLWDVLRGDFRERLPSHTKALNTSPGTAALCDTPLVRVGASAVLMMLESVLGCPSSFGGSHGPFSAFPQMFHINRVQNQGTQTWHCGSVGMFRKCSQKCPSTPLWSSPRSKACVHMTVAGTVEHQGSPTRHLYAHEPWSQASPEELWLLLDMDVVSTFAPLTAPSSPWASQLLASHPMGFHSSALSCPWPMFSMFPHSLYSLWLLTRWCTGSETLQGSSVNMNLVLTWSFPFCVEFLPE